LCETEPRQESVTQSQWILQGCHSSLRSLLHLDTGASGRSPIAIFQRLRPAILSWSRCPESPEQGPLFQDLSPCDRRRVPNLTSFSSLFQSFRCKKSPMASQGHPGDSKKWSPGLKGQWWGIPRFGITHGHHVWILMTTPSLASPIHVIPWERMFISKKLGPTSCCYKLVCKHH